MQQMIQKLFGFWRLKIKLKQVLKTIKAFAFKKV
jgi:hypothetical protein